MDGSLVESDGRKLAGVNVFDRVFHQTGAPRSQIVAAAEHRRVKPCFSLATSLAAPHRPRLFNPLRQRVVQPVRGPADRLLLRADLPTVEQASNVGPLVLGVRLSPKFPPAIER